MPRDGSGNYTLPAGNPVVTNTIITSTWANTTLADIAAQLNNVFTRDGLLGPTAPFKIVDGTVAAPGLAFNSEPGLGWYRPSAGEIRMAAGGADRFQFAGGSAVSSIAVRPGAANTATSFSIGNQPFGAANSQSLTFWLDTSAVRIVSDKWGSAANLPMYFQGAPSFLFEGQVVGTEGNTWGYAFKVNNYHQSGNNYFTDVLWANPNWDVNGMYLGAIFVPNQWAGWRFGAQAGGSIDFYVHDTTTPQVVLNGANSVVTASRFAGKADSALYVRNNADPNGTAMKFHWNDPGGQEQYLWGGSDGTYMRAINRNNLSVGRASRVDAIEGAGGGTIFGNSTFANSLWVNGDITVGASIYYNNNAGLRGNSDGNWWRWYWNGNQGDPHFYCYVDGGNQGWATLNSDERLKKDITSLESDTEAFMRLKPINFRWKLSKSITQETPYSDGLSAQNVRDCFPMAAFGDFDTPPKEDGTMDFPGTVDDRAVLAHVILQVQKLVRQGEALGTRIAALEAA